MTSLEVDGLRKPELQLCTKTIKDNLAVEVSPGIWLGSLHAAFNAEGLNERGITHIVNLSGLPATFPGSFTYLSIDIRDKGSSDILSCIPASNIFIESALNSGGSVLVHCFGGRSRSPAIIMAFLMSTTNCSYDEALHTVWSVRNVVAPNAGFEMQLRAYAAAGSDVYQAHQLLLHARLTRVSTVKRRRSAIVFHRPISRSRRGSQASNHSSSSCEDDDSKKVPAVHPIVAAPSAPSVSPAVPLPCPTVREPAQIRLSRPNTKAVQVIPQLKGLDWAFKCRCCSTTLFLSSSIFQHKQGKNPSVPSDMSWMRPSASSSLGDGPVRSSNTPPVHTESKTPSPSLGAMPSPGLPPPAALPAGFAASGSAHAESKPEKPAHAGAAKPRFNSSLGMGLAGGGTGMQKAKSFAFGGSMGASAGLDPFSFGGSLVPPTPSHRRGRGATRSAADSAGGSRRWGQESKMARTAFGDATPIEEEGDEEDSGDDDDDNNDDDDDDEGGEATVVPDVDEADAFAAAMALSGPPPMALGGALVAPMATDSPEKASEPPALAMNLSSLDSPAKCFGGPGSGAGGSASLSLPLSLPLPSAAGGGSGGAEAMATTSPGARPPPPLGLNLGLSSAAPVAPAPPLSLTLAPTTPSTAPPTTPSIPPRHPGTPSTPSTAPPRRLSSASPSAPQSNTAASPPPVSAKSPLPSPGQFSRACSAEKSRFLEKMKWLEEAGLEPGTRRSDAEVAASAGGVGSSALSRRGLRRIRSSTAMQVAAADEEAAKLLCECVFVEPLQWMGDLRGSSGPLRCPNADCGTELGFYNWNGASCTCGSYVSSAFSIKLSKVWREQPKPRKFKRED